MNSNRLKIRIVTMTKIIGFFSMGFSLSLLPDILISLFYHDHEAIHFASIFAVIFLFGAILWLATRHKVLNLSVRDGFLIVVIFWVLISLLASWPLFLGAHLSFVDAIFESISAFTTTGSTVITNLDVLPKSILFYRQELQWFGGMGMVVLAIAVLPMIGVGGMQLYKAEAPGPFKEQKMTPRLSQTARSLWGIYVIMTLSCALAYWFAGMTPFDALSHSLSTVSTGGFSTHNESLGYFHSRTIEGVAIFFMLLGAINFSIHYIVWRSGSLKAYFLDVEVRNFLLFVIGVVLFSSVLLFKQGTYLSFFDSFENAFFEVVTIVTSTGFGTADFSAWPGALPVLLIFISFVGGCGGSTAGGVKVMRINVIVQQGLREIKRLIHPHALYPIRVGKQLLEEKTVEAVWGFIAMYMLVFVILMLFMIQTGLDQVTAFSAIATCMNNLGPGLGDVTTTFAGISDSGKIIAMIAMLLGRLEVFTVLVILTPSFWRQ